MVSNDCVAERLLQILNAADLYITTTSALRRQLEEELGVDLSDKKDFIREQVNLYLHQKLHKQQKNQFVQPQQHSHHQLQPQQLQHHQNQLHYEHLPHSHHVPHEKIEVNTGPKEQMDAHGNVDDQGIVEGYKEQIKEEEGGKDPKTSHVKSSRAKKEKNRHSQTKVEPQTTILPQSQDELGTIVAKEKKRQSSCGGLNKLCGLSPELQVITGEKEMTRTQVAKQVWVYIREKNLQDPGDKRNIICDDALRAVTRCNATDMFNLNKLLAKHIISLDNHGDTSDDGEQKSKRRRREKRRAEDTKDGASAAPTTSVLEGSASPAPEKFTDVSEI